MGFLTYNNLDAELYAGFLEVSDSLKQENRALDWANVKPDSNNWQRHVGNRVLKIVLAARGLYDPNAFRNSTCASRIAMWKRVVSLAPVRVMTEFWGTVATIINLEQVYYLRPRTILLDNWRMTLGVKFVTHVETCSPSSKTSATSKSRHRRQPFCRVSTSSGEA
jgi:hypothetical protein